MRVTRSARGAVTAVAAASIVVIAAGVALWSSDSDTTVPRFTSARVMGTLWKPLGRTTSVALSASPSRSLFWWWHNPSGDPQTARDALLLRAARGDATAAEGMETIARRARNDAGLWSDAAALRIAQAAATNDVRLAVDALASADEALAVDDTLAAAHFNRALSLERLGLARPARASYFRAALSEDDGGWRDEALARAGALKRPTVAMEWSAARARLVDAASRGDDTTVRRLVDAFPQQSRTWAEGPCLTSWAAAMRGHRGDEAARLLAAARAVGKALRQASGESLLAEVVESLDAAARREDVLLGVLAGYGTYEQGRIANNDRSPNRAALLLGHSGRSFARWLPPMELVARYFGACAQFDAGRGNEALLELRRLDRLAKPSYFAVRAQVQWQIGTILIRRGALEEALEAFQRALRTFDRLGESEFAARMRTSCATALHLLGQPAEAWRIEARAMAIASASGNDNLLEFVIGEAAYDEVVERRWAAARALFDVAIRSIPPTNPRRRFDILQWRALLSAAPDFRAARDELAMIPDATLRADAENDLRFAMARTIRDRDPRGAVALFSSCLDYLRAHQNSGLTLPHVFLERGRAWRRAGSNAEATADLETAVTLFEHRRQSIAQRDLRDAFFGTADEAFEELIDLYWTSGDAARVLTTMERKRGRIVLDALADGEVPARPWTAAELMSRIEPATAFLVLTTFHDRAGALLVTRDGLSERLITQPRPVLETGVTALRMEIETRRSTMGAEGLYKLLFRPFSASLARVKKLVIVADGSFEPLPFAALRDARTGAFVGETFALVHAMSVTAYLRSPRWPHAAARARIVSVGDPAFSRALFPSLPSLPGAKQEAARVARLYPDGAVLTGGAATYSRFASELPAADVVHVAAHGVVQTHDATLSKLLFAPEGEDSGACTVSRLSHLRMKRGALVVLSGCRTAVRGAGYGDLRDFATPFLAAGAASVVATLWNVDDDAMRDLMMSFHEQIRSGVRPAEALRAARSAALHSANPRLHDPAVWAGVQIYGDGD